MTKEQLDQEAEREWEQFEFDHGHLINLENYDLVRAIVIYTYKLNKATND